MIKKGLSLVQIITLSILTMNGICQDSIDRISTVVPSKYENDFDDMWKIAYDLFEIDNRRALFYIKRAHKIAMDNGDSLRIVQSGRLMGQLLWRVDKIDQSVRDLTFVKGVAERNGFVEESGRIKNALAAGYAYSAKYDKALQVHFDLLQQREKEQDKKAISITLNNIGLVYSYLNFYDLAIKYFFNSLRIKDDINYDVDKDILLANIGDCYNSLGYYDSARSYFAQALKHSSGPSFDRVILVCEYGLGLTYYHEKDLDRAEKHVMKALKLSREKGNQYRRIHCLLLMAKIDLIRREYGRCEESFLEIDGLPDLAQYPNEMLEYFDIKSEWLIGIGQFESASKVQSDYIALRKSVGSADVARNVMQAQAEFVERENIARLNSQTRILDLQNEVIRRRGLLNICLILVVILILIIVAILISRGRRRKEINKMLDLMVRERTMELECNRDELRKAYSEYKQIVEGMCSQLGSFLATQKGLAKIAYEDLPPYQAEYFSHAEKNFEKLSEQLIKVMRKSTLK